MSKYDFFTTSGNVIIDIGKDGIISYSNIPQFIGKRAHSAMREIVAMHSANSLMFSVETEDENGELVKLQGKATFNRENM